MKVIDHSEFRDEEGQISLEDRIRGTLKYGFSWYGQIQAQEFTTQRLDKKLSDDHVLLRNIFMPGASLPIPMILLSPQGVRVLVPNSVRGIFRAQGDEWQKFHGRSRRFRPSRPNLIREATQLANAVHRLIQDQGYALPEVEAVIVFTNPRTHVDYTQPRARIVLADAIEHFAANLQKLQPIMDQEDIHNLSEALLHPAAPAAEPEEEPEPLAREEGPAPREPQMGIAPSELELSNIPFLSNLTRLGLSRRQWILLGLIAFFELIVLIILTILVIANTLYV